METLNVRMQINELDLNIDLTLFGKADDESRTEQPTAHKEKKSRERGEVAQSKELVSCLVLFFAGATLWLFADFFRQSNMYLFNDMFLELQKGVISSPLEFGNYLKNQLFYWNVVALPILFVTFCGGLLGHVVQIGFVFTIKPLQLQWRKISPFGKKMLSKIFFSPEALSQLIKSLLKLCIFILMAWSFWDMHRVEIMRAMMFGNVLDTVQLFGLLFFQILSISCLFVLLLSIPDYFFQKWRHRENLKMTHHEVKEERREMEGDPIVKQRQKELQKSMFRLQTLKEARKADFIVVNPTHYAVAIRYDIEQGDVPFVVAKGKDYMALKIKEIAKEEDIHIESNALLAKSLYFSVKQGDEIQEEFYQAIAEILAFVLKDKEHV